MRLLSDAGVPVMLMCAPIIPGLNSDEMPSLIKAAAESGAKSASFTLVRLNGEIASIFEDWIEKAFPDRAEKVLNMIKECHGGKLNDSQWGRRMKGDGKLAESIHSLFSVSVKRYMGQNDNSALRTDLFVSKYGKQLDLF
jgi:DNA repair photolyase